LLTVAGCGPIRRMSLDLNKKVDTLASRYTVTVSSHCCESASIPKLVARVALGARLEAVNGRDASKLLHPLMKDFTKYAEEQRPFQPKRPRATEVRARLQQTAI